jgi:hypothetical protein
MEQFRTLKKVTGFSEDGAYAFIEGELTGAPVGELEIGDAPLVPPAPPHAKPPRYAKLQDGAKNMRNEVYSLESGDEVVITWPHPLPSVEVEDIKNWLKIVERKLARSAGEPARPQDTEKP